MSRLPVFLLLFSSAALSAQATQSSGEVIRLSVVVDAKNGPPLGGFQQHDFTLLDNKAAQPITSFQAVPAGAPAEAILVLDAVNSGQISLANERQQLDKFLSANGGELPVPTTLALLTDKGMEAIGASTTDGLALRKIVDSKEIGIRFVGRSTGFYGATERLVISLHGLQSLTSVAARTPGRKLMIWVSPGWPVLSGPGIQLSSHDQDSLFAEIIQFSTLLRRSGVVLYSADPRGAGQSLGRETYYQNFTKGIRKPSQTDAGDLALQTLVEQTGGLVLNSDNDIADMLRRAVGDASPSYEISFAGAPGEHPNEYHSIDVKVNRPGVVARTRQGYYTQTVSPAAGDTPGNAANK